ncbi:MAG: ferredoxin reductase [Pseudomonadota bacterium]
MSRLITPLIDPAVFDFWVSYLNPAWSWDRPLARVVARQLQAKDTVTLVLKPNRHVGAFQPGQHVNVSAEVNGRRITRSYSPSHVPNGKGRIAITVKKVDGGLFSQHLCHDVQVGDVLELGPAFGEMTLPEQPQGKWLLLAAGSGITPMISLIRALADMNMPVDLSLIYWARTRAELCFVQELHALAARHPRFHLRLVLTREPERLVDEEQGRLSPEQLQSWVGDLSTHQVYACGPAAFVKTARELAAPHALRFHAEAFSLPAAPATPETLPQTVQVELRASGRTLTLPTGQSLLTALEAQGIKPASGCRMGICNTCACHKLAGTTQHLYTGDIDAQPASALRICMSSACSDLTLDL